MIFQRNFLAALAIVAATSSVVIAESGIPYVWQITPHAEDVSLFVLPDDSGPPLTQAMTFGGQVIDASIDITLTDLYGAPVANFPFEDMWLDTETITGGRCPGYGHFSPDTSTDYNGLASFTTALGGGGWTEGPMWFYLNGDRARHPDGWQHPPITLRFNSADLNHDGSVNLSDIAIFAADLYGPYHYRSDFFWDRTINLTDVVKMASGLGHNCQ